MLKALRIASIFTVIAAIVVVGFIALFGLKGNSEIETFLQREGIVEQFRKKIQNIPAKADTASPLELSAKAFALRIDPPPPPAPIKPIAPPPPTVTPPVAAQLPRPPVENKPVLSAKFTLEATARYPEHPQKSLALLKTVQNEYKWYKHGEQVGHLEIQEIKDGSIVLYQGGKFNSELFMPAPPKARSLLKGEDTGTDVPQGPVAVTVSTEPGQPAEETADVTGLPDSAGAAPKRTIPSRLEAYREGRTTPAAALRTSPPPTMATAEPPPPPVQTPEEQKKSLDESISSIQQMMKNAPAEGQNEEEFRQEQEAWKQLLDVLNQERSNFDQMSSEAEQPAEPATEQ